MRGQKPLCYSGSVFFWYTPKRDVAGTHGSSIFSFGETSILILIAAALVCVPISRVLPNTRAHAHNSHAHTHNSHLTSICHQFA